MIALSMISFACGKLHGVVAPKKNVCTWRDREREEMREEGRERERSGIKRDDWKD